MAFLFLLWVLIIFVYKSDFSVHVKKKCLFQSRSVDKQHAVITVNTQNKEYKLHDLGTLNGVSTRSL